jgi:hypothetical protein
MPDYTKGKIYAIRSHQTEEVYIGSSVQTLCVRLAGHRRSYNHYMNGDNHYVTSFDILKYGDAYIELIEHHSCLCKEELHKREGQLIRETPNCVNKHIAGRTNKEYNEDNKDKIKQASKQYRDENKDRLNQQSRQYYEDNKDKIAQQQKQYCENNKDRLKQYKKQYYEDNKDTLNQYKKQYYEQNHEQYYKDNKDRINQRRRQRRADKKKQATEP